MDEITSLLTSQSKHGNYQMLPPALVKKVPSLQKFSNSKRLDDKRYDWISQKINFKNKHILDIGANIGYFSLRFASEKNAYITMYEPQKQHAKAIHKITRLLDIENADIVNEGIAMNDISKLSKFDVILLFNVIQHAGDDYDRNYVTDITEWRSYAVSYLKQLSQKGKFMVFQTGYTWLGSRGPLCENNNIIDFTAKLLNEAGWTIKNCGIIDSILNPKYEDYTIKTQNNKHPLFSLKNRILIKIINSLKVGQVSTRFMQRPIFICESVK
jgi:uncharacterized protein DUF1698